MSGAAPGDAAAAAAVVAPPPAPSTADVDPPNQSSSVTADANPGDASDLTSLGRSDAQGDSRQDEDAADPSAAAAAPEGEVPEDEYEIEAILSHEVGRFERGEIAYLVSWVGYGPVDNSWVREQDAEHAEQMLADYWAKAPDHLSKVLVTSGTKRRRGVDANDDGPAATRAGRSGRGRRRGSATSLSRQDGSGVASGANKYEELADWEGVVRRVESVERLPDGRVVAFLVFNDGGRFAYDAKVPNHRCPQKMLAFYEASLRLYPRPSEASEQLREQQSNAEERRAREVEERSTKQIPPADATQENGDGGEVGGGAGGEGGREEAEGDRARQGSAPGAAQEGQEVVASDEGAQAANVEVTEQEVTAKVAITPTQTSRDVVDVAKEKDGRQARPKGDGGPGQAPQGEADEGAPDAFVAAMELDLPGPERGDAEAHA